MMLKWACIKLIIQSSSELHTSLCQSTEQEQAVKPGAQLTQKKLRQNFAAEGCGAKVVSSNAEAENVNFLLNGNPDEYMISPCKAKKWSEHKSLCFLLLKYQFIFIIFT